eukprot:COSAG02_NODE_926_length_15856_cov_13.975566_5_plen_280_part_00
MDAQECLRRGAIGAVGAVPGTMLAHPFDVLKIRMQTDPVSNRSLPAASRSVYAAHGMRGFYRGLAAGVQQKVLTRGPMFLASEACTQVCELTMGMNRTPAVFCGSLGSGYLTGSLAALAEWRKVLASSPAGGQWQRRGGSLELLRAAVAAHQLRSAVQRIHNAGCRNALFDVTFFGVSHLLMQQLDGQDTTVRMLGPGGCYALAATAAVVSDYAVDVSTKRSMALPPLQAVRTLRSSVVRLVRKDGLGLFAGLSPKSLEFATSYFVTGATSMYVLAKLA